MRSVASLTVHAQTTSTRQPIAVKLAILATSLARFRSILAVQKSTFDFEGRPRGQLCPCQKQPCTKIANRCRGSTRSGDPGRSRRWSRNRYPAANNRDRTSFSGAVCSWRTAAIIAERAAALTRSTMIPICSRWVRFDLEPQMSAGWPSPARTR